MSEIKQESIGNLPVKRKSGHEGYEYAKRTFVSRRDAAQCVVAIYEIPPLKAGYPYHWHANSEEVFYLLSGSGTLKTPDGERAVGAGELLYFPATPDGAHKLTNTSETEPLVYIDFDTANAVDATIYPDSGKLGVWGAGLNKVFRTDDEVDYYAGE